MASKYQAGVCNIGQDEINYRKRIVGYGSAIISVALYTMLVFFNVPIILYVILFVPLFISTHGFIEAKHRFCTSYARSGKYNMASEVGVTQNVISRDKRSKDKAFAKMLTIRSLKISLLITVALVGISRVLN